MRAASPYDESSRSRLAAAAALAEMQESSRLTTMHLTTRARTSPNRNQLLPLSLLACGLTGLSALPARAETCQFLNPVGGNGVTPIVTKTVSAGNPLPFGRPNWNTDFYVTQQYQFFKLFFTANSSVSATYPIQAYLKFSDGSNLRVYDGNVAPTPGTGGSIRVAGYPGKQVDQVNIKVGATNNMAATGFTYRISVQGCN